MIDLIFNRANEVVLVRINGRDVTFGSTLYGAQMASIEGLKLDFRGTIKEFPDLENDLEWREKAISRFKIKIQALESEEAISNYIISELKDKGYTPKLKQKAGMRAVKIS